MVATGMSIRWIEESDLNTLGTPPRGEFRWLGQTPVTVQNHNALTTIEKTAIIGVVISAISLGVSLWHLAKKGQLL